MTTTSSNPIKSFLQARQNLLALRKQKQMEIEEIDQMLSNAAPVAKTAQTLTSLIVDALKHGAKSKQQILEAVTKSGWEFRSGKPLATLDSILYTKRFKHQGKLFRLAPAAAAASGKKSK